MTSTDQGGEATLVDPASFDPDVQRLAVRAASLMGCDVAAINLMQDLITGDWYVLDTNPAPAIGTGPFAEEKVHAIATYLGKHARRIPNPLGDH